MNPLSVTLIGGGRVGAVLAKHFLKANYPLLSIIDRNTRRRSRLEKFFPSIAIEPRLNAQPLARSDLIAICVQDDHIVEVVDQILKLNINLRKKVIIHTSGAHSSEILKPLAQGGAYTAGAHPIYTFAGNDPTGLSLKGVYFDLEGHPEAVNALQSFLERIEARWIQISGDQKIPLHLAAVLYSNYFVILTHFAQQGLRSGKIPLEHFWEPFLPLIQATLKNLSLSSPDQALTGPLQRGDVKTIETHLKFLRANVPDGVPVYISLAEFLLPHLDLPESRRTRLQQLFDGFKSL